MVIELLILHFFKYTFKSNIIEKYMGVICILSSSFYSNLCYVVLYFFQVCFHNGRSISKEHECNLWCLWVATNIICAGDSLYELSGVTQGAALLPGFFS